MAPALIGEALRQEQRRRAAQGRRLVAIGEDGEQRLPAGIGGLPIERIGQSPPSQRASSSGTGHGSGHVAWHVPHASGTPWRLVFAGTGTSIA